VGVDDPAGRSGVRRRLAASGERLRRRAGNRPPSGWARQGRTDLMVTKRGKVIRSAGPWQWTPRAEARFLGELGKCCNLSQACVLAGMTLSSLEAHLRRWPDFRRRVDETLVVRANPARGRACMGDGKVAAVRAGRAPHDRRDDPGGPAAHRAARLTDSRPGRGAVAVGPAA
jgi:hypothetical protein